MYARGASGEIPRAPAMAPAETEIRVVNMDCLEAAQAMLDMSPAHTHRVAVLNMANATTPGGGWLHGAGAQEHGRRFGTDEFDCHVELNRYS